MKFTTKLLRFFIALLGALIGFAFVYYFGATFLLPGSWQLYVSYVFSILVFAIIFYLLSGVLIKLVKSIVNSIDNDIKNVNVADFILGLIGLVLGVVVSSIFNIAVNMIKIPLVNITVSIIVYAIVIPTSITIILRRKEDIKKLFRGINNRSDRSDLKVNEHNSVTNTVRTKILDTSVIIDGRIYDIVKTGFLEGRLIVPSFVLGELQYIADSEDASKRQRGRRGLDILNKLMQEYSSFVSILECKDASDKEVDMRLLDLAISLNAILVTNDYNLNKVAGVKNVNVLNINDLANAVKPVVLPGESLSVTISGKGKEHGQGVAYLNDGTMIVVEGGDQFIDMSVILTVTSVLQTSAGRLIFAKVKND